jgi:integrase
LQETKTERSRRTIALPESVARVLKTHRIRQLEQRLAAGSDWHETGLTFVTGRGTPIDPSEVARDFKRTLTHAKLPPMRFHDLRHSAASLLLAQGAPLRAIMELLGHSTIALTANTYAHVMPEMMRDVAAKMDALLGR